MKNLPLHKAVCTLPLFKVGIFVVASLLTGCQQAVDKDDLKANIEKANQTWMEAVQKKDASAVSDMYTEDAFILAPNAPAIQGREGVKGFFSTVLNSGIQKVRLVTEDVEGTDENAIEKGTYEMMVDGDQVVDKGKYLVHWKNVDGKWMFHRDMFNSDMPAAAGPSMKKGNLVGVHVVSVKLKPGITLNQFEEFYNTTVIPEGKKHLPEATIFLTKGRRGENQNKLGLIYHFESEQVRNKYFKDDGTANEAGQAMLDKMQPTFDTLSKEYGTMTTKYTDWIIE